MAKVDVRRYRGSARLFLAGAAVGLALGSGPALAHSIPALGEGVAAAVHAVHGPIVGINEEAPDRIWVLFDDGWQGLCVSEADPVQNGATVTATIGIAPVTPQVTPAPITNVTPVVTPVMTPQPTIAPTPVATVAPTPVPTVKSKGNCGVGNGLDPDTKGCPNGRNDGPGTAPGTPGSKGGGGNGRK